MFLSPEPNPIGAWHPKRDNYNHILTEGTNQIGKLL